MKDIKQFCKKTFGSRCVIADDVILLHGSCLKIVPYIAKQFGQVADCWINDPPYGTTLLEWDSVIHHDVYWELANLISAPTAPRIVFGSQPFTSAVVMSNVDDHRYCLVWDKNKCGSPGLAKYRPMKTHEDIMVFSRKTHPYYPQMESGEAYSRFNANAGMNNHKYGFKRGTELINAGTRYPKSVLRFSRNFSAQQQIHPTQKPDTLLEWLVRSYTQERELVIDITAGSCSTGIAAYRAKRGCICIEREQKYFDAGKAWLTAIHEGRTWNPAHYRKQFMESKV